MVGSTAAPGMVYVVIGVVVLALGVFVWRRYTSVERGARQRDERIARTLDPVGRKLAGNEAVAAEEVAALADRPELRPMLYSLLKHYERLELFPERHLDVRAQGEAMLAYWMMHPNEFQDAPERIEFVEAMERPLDDEGTKGEFLVFRFRMADGHWAAGDGWLLGLAGPFFDGDVPYSGIAAAFSRASDRHGEVEPAEMVDWYVAVLTGRRV